MGNSPGRAHREGLSITDLTDMFPSEEAASLWFENVLWPDGRCCGHCGSTRTSPVASRKPMPFWCSDCREYFSVKTGTAMQRSKIPLRKWAIAIYLCLTSLKSVSSMKLRRDIGVSQKTAWFMLHRIREAWATETPGGYTGPVEVDETFVGGKAKNMHKWQRDKLTGRGGADKMAVVGVRDRATKKVRATVIGKVQAPMLRGFVVRNTVEGATVYTDGQPAYQGMANHDSVVRPREGPHERHGELLVDAEAGAHRDVPQAEPEPPEPVRSGVRQQERHPRFRDSRSDAGHRRPEPLLPQPDRRQRVAERRATVRVAVGRERGPGFPESRRPGRVSSRAWVASVSLLVASLSRQRRAHSRFPGHALTPTGVMAIRCKQFHLPDL